MEQLTLFLFEHVQYAHWILFVLLLLTGFCLPVSEDLLIIIGGALASQVSAEQGAWLFLCVFWGSYLSDWEAYWVGRYLGPKILQFAWFKRLLSPHLLQKIEHFYQRYGAVTLFIGRFIPFGVRNALFVAAGISRMHFGKFLISDGIACLLSSFLLFYFAYHFGMHYQLLVEYLGFGNLLFFSGALAVILIALAIYWIRQRDSSKIH